MSQAEREHPKSQLSRLFGSYRAEWLKDDLFSLYTEPRYFPALTTPRPCVLVGGRGTGKTTVLRGLSWEGRTALTNRPVDEWEYVGVYHRVNTARVTAFKGPELPEDDWTRLFGHYFNLVICESIAKFVLWASRHSSHELRLTEEVSADVSLSLGLEPVTNVSELKQLLAKGRLSFEAYVNNVADAPRPTISMAGAPIDAFVEGVLETEPLRNKSFFIMLDEYENFRDEQQQLVNTLLKHSTSFAFKIGVRELGWRVRTTMNVEEQLRHPADYVKIDIASELDPVFEDFAVSICNDRIERVVNGDKGFLRKVQDLLPKLSEDDEAKLLGIESQVEQLRRQLLSVVDESDLKAFDALPLLFQYLIGFWSSGRDETLKETYEDFISNRSAWETRYVNYKHSLLYTLRRGKRGIRKYYAGYDTYSKLSGNNIRFFLELVERTLIEHLDRDRTLSFPVPPDVQTRGAQAVSRKNLSELEGLSRIGSYLTRLCLGLGRVFQVMAEDPAGHSPEVNQFHLVDGEETTDKAPSGDGIDVTAHDLLRDAVMHLALVRFPGTKLVDQGDIHEYDYMLHPVFAPLFGFSYRQKRKMMLSSSELLGLVHHPRRTIRGVLARTNRTLTSETEGDLPDQLLLFDAFFRADA